MEVIQWIIDSPWKGVCAILLSAITILLTIIGIFVKSKAKDFELHQKDIKDDIKAVGDTTESNTKKITDLKEQILDSTVKINQFMNIEFQQIRKILPSETLQNDMINSINKNKEFTEEVKKLRNQHEAIAKVLKKFREELDVLHIEVKNERIKRTS